MDYTTIITFQRKGKKIAFCVDGNVTGIENIVDVFVEEEEKPPIARPTPSVGNEKEF